jgi:hypothetical protein
MNLHVQSLIEALNTRGETTTDLHTNLFKGYKAAKDEKFVEYIEKKEEYYEEGNDLGANELMSLAKTKWSIRKQKHLWNAPSKQEEKILALEAKVKKLEFQRSKEDSKQVQQGWRRISFNPKQPKPVARQWSIIITI